MKSNQPMFPIPASAAASGASQLQWLAGLAMQSLILRLEGVPDSEIEREEIALWAYRMAQAMQRTESLLKIDKLETPL